MYGVVKLLKVSDAVIVRVPVPVEGTVAVMSNPPVLLETTDDGDVVRDVEPILNVTAWFAIKLFPANSICLPSGPLDGMAGPNPVVPANIAFPLFVASDAVTL